MGEAIETGGPLLEGAMGRMRRLGVNAALDSATLVIHVDSKGVAACVLARLTKVC
jgi:hypothetical protein